MKSQKWQNDLCLFPRQTVQCHSNPSLFPNQLCWGSWSWKVLWRSTTPSGTNTPKRCPFHCRDWNAKVGSQEVPGSVQSLSRVLLFATPWIAACQDSPCPSPTPGVHSDSRPSSQWCHPAISSSVIPFSSCPQSLPGPGVTGKFKPLTELWKILKEMVTPDHLTFLRNLYARQEATVRTGHGTTDWFQIGKEVHQGCILSPCLFNLYAGYIMRNTGLKEA